jgi:uncharacterized membrane protein YbhN (UPF0104 family)/tRNA A-37 threonylcarbamoyl transferase component Bud32
VVTVAPVETTSGRGVVVVEARLPRRARRPADLFRLALAVLLLVLAVTLGAFAVSTSSGLEQDLIQATRGVAKVAVLLGTVASGVGTLAVTVGLSVDLMIRRRTWQLLDALVAATLGIGVAFGLRAWIVHVQPGRILEALTKVVDGQRTQPIQGLLVAVVAFLTLAGLAGRRFWHWAASVSVGAVAVFGFLSGRVTALSTVVSLLLGWSVGLAVRYVIGAASTRPSGAEVADALVSTATPVVRLERLVDESVEPRRYLAHQPDGALLRVEVLDRDTYGSATFYRLGRRLRVRGPVTRRSFLTVRTAIEHVALMVLAARQAGACVPELVAVSEVGPYAALIAFRHLPGRGLARAADEDGEVDDSVLRGTWEQLRVLQRRKIAHRSLTAENILLTDSGQVALLDLSGGDIAASDLILRLDTAQLLATLSVLVGPQRAVRTAVTVLGPNPVIDALPLLQRIALTRGTRRQLKERKGLLHDLRAQIIDITPADTEVEEIKLERISARTLIAVIGGAVALYVIATRFTQVNFASLSSLNWGWAALTMVFATLTFFAAGMTCAGFVIQRISLWRATLAQYAVGFAGLLAPTAVGTVAINVRFLERSGVDPAVAVSSVGLVQLVMFVGHILLLVVFGVLAGTGANESFTPPQGAVIAVLVLVILAIVGLSLPIGRRLIQQRVRPMVRRVVPQLVAVFQAPRKLALGMGGALLLNIAYILSLDTAVRAFDVSLPFATVAVVYLAGSVVGSAVPTPGGIGAIELAMASGLTAAGVPAGIAFPAVLLYRIATFWIPIPVGWGSLTYLQHKGAL